MKNSFKRIMLLATISLAHAEITQTKTADKQLEVMHKKIKTLHQGFELIFLKGDKEGHLILSKIEAIPLNEDNSEVGKKLNALIKELNAIFKTVHHIVTKYKGKGKGVSVNFLFEIGRSCNLEELFKKTIAELENILKLVESVNESEQDRAELKSFIAFLKTIQPVWHDALSQKERIVQNLRSSLEKA